jgi:hypothetical protein
LHFHKLLKTNDFNFIGKKQLIMSFETVIGLPFYVEKVS